MDRQSVMVCKSCVVLKVIFHVVPSQSQVASLVNIDQPRQSRLASEEIQALDPHIGGTRDFNGWSWSWGWGWITASRVNIIEN